MKLNKSSSYVLLSLLSGATTATEVAKQMNGVDVRSIQRALMRLVEMGLIAKHGPRNSPSYSVSYAALLKAEIPEKLLEDESRPQTTVNHGLMRWIQQANPQELASIFPLFAVTPAPGNNMTAKELEYLTVELSWKSSALEGNTYTLLDTQLLLLEGVKAKNKTEFETQMILNHKTAIAFIVENKNLFSENISLSTVEELHKRIAYNLGIDNGIRKKLVRISASNYTPLANPHQLKEYAVIVLTFINELGDPIQKALFALLLIPYLQIFEDGNKRTGRMLSNAILISSIGRGFSLRSVSAKQLAIAYLAFYEFNSALPLQKILAKELSDT